MTVYLNGKLLPIDEARISVLDRGFIYGDGVYELVPVYRRQPYRLPQHLARLRRRSGQKRLHVNRRIVQLANDHRAVKRRDVFPRPETGQFVRDRSLARFLDLDLVDYRVHGTPANKGFDEAAEPVLADRQLSFDLRTAVDSLGLR